MAPPVMTEQERAVALEKARRARTERAELKGRLKAGSVTLLDVLKKAGSDDVVGKTKVADLLASMPGVGKVGAQQIMGRLGIDAGRRARGLGAAQRAALEAEFASA
jgi:hypothetical protein